METVLKEDFNRRIDLENLIRFVSRRQTPLGDIVVMRNPNSEQKFILKEKVFYSEESFLEEVIRIKKRRAIDNLHITRLIDFSSYSKVDSYDEKYYVNCYYEFNSNTLRAEIEARKAMGMHFTNEEITYMTLDLIDGLASLEEKGLPHAEISPDLVYLSEDRRFMLGDRVQTNVKPPQNMINNYFKARQKSKGSSALYLSPEVFIAIDERKQKPLELLNYYRSDIFVLGLCILEAGILEPDFDIYPHTEIDVTRLPDRVFDRQRLVTYISIFERFYYNNGFVLSLIRKMLDLEDANRPTAYELKSALPDAFQVMNTYFEGLRKKQTSDGGRGNRNAAKAELKPEPAKPSEVIVPPTPPVISTPPPEEPKPAKKPKGFLGNLFEKNDGGFQNNNTPKTNHTAPSPTPFNTLPNQNYPARPPNPSFPNPNPMNFTNNFNRNYPPNQNPPRPPQLNMSQNNSFNGPSAPYQPLHQSNISNPSNDFFDFGQTNQQPYNFNSQQNFTPPQQNYQNKPQYPPAPFPPNQNPSMNQRPPYPPNLPYNQNQTPMSSQKAIPPKNFNPGGFNPMNQPPNRPPPIYPPNFSPNPGNSQSEKAIHPDSTLQNRQSNLNGMSARAFNNPLNVPPGSFTKPAQPQANHQKNLSIPMPNHQVRPHSQTPGDVANFNQPPNQKPVPKRFDIFGKK